MCLGLLLIIVVWDFLFRIKFRVRSFNTFDLNFEMPSREPDCPALPHNLLGRLEVIQTPASWEEIEMELSETDLTPGGLFSPACKTEHRGVFYVYLRNIKQPNIQLSVAIIVPFRDRDTHLRIFLRHIHPFLMRQNILYRLEIWILFS